MIFRVSFPKSFYFQYFLFYFALQKNTVVDSRTVTTTSKHGRIGTDKENCVEEKRERREENGEEKKEEEEKREKHNMQNTTFNNDCDNNTAEET